MRNCISYYGLSNWIEGVFEDDPLDDELKYIYFCVEHKNNDLFLMFFAKETLDRGDIVNQLNYFPLEAQYYSDKRLRSLMNFNYKKNKITNLAINSLLLSLIMVKHKKHLFDKDIKIVIGEIGCKARYILE